MINNDGHADRHNGNGHNGNRHGQLPRASTNAGTVTVGDKSDAPAGRAARFEAADFDDEMLLEGDAELSLGEGDEPATHDLQREAKRGGRLRRIVVGLIAICAFGLVMALVAYFWLFSSAHRDEMSLQVRSST